MISVWFWLKFVSASDMENVADFKTATLVVMVIRLRRVVVPVGFPFERGDTRRIELDGCAGERR